MFDQCWSRLTYRWSPALSCTQMSMKTSVALAPSEGHVMADNDRQTGTLSLPWAQTSKGEVERLILFICSLNNRAQFPVNMRLTRFSRRTRTISLLNPPFCESLIRNLTPRSQNNTTKTAPCFSAQNVGAEPSFRWLIDIKAGAIETPREIKTGSFLHRCAITPSWAFFNPPPPPSTGSFLSLRKTGGYDKSESTWRRFLPPCVFCLECCIC